MYKVIMVEDEPGAAENIRDIFRLYCPLFEIIASAESGDIGLEMARRYKPDLLITDIRMPKMSGLELIRHLHEELPSLKTIIISGYQDFEYSRTAMQYSAADYLLKPVTPAALQAALGRIVPLIDDTISQKRLSLIQRLLNNDISEGGELEKYFTAPAYTMAISRKNGLPSRFSRNAYNFKYSTGETAIDMYARDEMESLHICSDNSIISQEGFSRIKWFHQDIPGYTTTVVWPDPFPIQKLPHIIKSLYNILDSSLSIGISKVISANTVNSKHIKKNNELDYETARLMDHYIRETKIEQINKLFPDFLEKCRQEKCPQLYVEKSVRLLFEKIRSHLNRITWDDEFEFMIDDAFFYATSYEELKESFSDILKRLLSGQNEAISKIDTPEFFALIREYISFHLAEPLTLQSMCKHFGISQTYISRLFRKYTGQSFINYLTGIRIEKAKEYLVNRDILIKDAAAMVGFSDQFYFSRVFRTITGQSPSKYLRVNNGG